MEDREPQTPPPAAPTPLTPEAQDELLRQSEAEMFGPVKGLHAY